MYVKFVGFSKREGLCCTLVSFVEHVSVFSPWLPLRKQQQLELKRGRGL